MRSQTHLISALNNAAQFATFRHHFKSAIPSLSEAVDIGRRLRSLGVGDQELGESLFINVCWLSWCTSLSGNPDSAMRINEEILEPLERELEASCRDQRENNELRGYRYTAKAFAAVNARKWDEAQFFAKKLLACWGGPSNETQKQTGALPNRTWQLGRVPRLRRRLQCRVCVSCIERRENAQPGCRRWLCPETGERAS